MAKLAWSLNLAVGNAEMDAAHHVLINELASLLDGPDGEIEARLPALVARLERDFRDEELLMETIEFPAIRQHREQHARVLSALHHTDAADGAAVRTTLRLLPQWLEMHVATMDRALAAAVEAVGAHTGA